jgi:hypothetical protein
MDCRVEGRSGFVAQPFIRSVTERATTLAVYSCFMTLEVAPVELTGLTMGPAFRLGAIKWSFVGRPSRESQLGP